MKADPIFVDTYLFLRFLTNDVPAQADAVERLLRQQKGIGKIYTYDQKHFARFDDVEVVKP